eukprot:3254661-Pleurochrysis_carterae.AAC.1
MCVSARVLRCAGEASNFGARPSVGCGRDPGISAGPMPKLCVRALMHGREHAPVRVCMLAYLRACVLAYTRVCARAFWSSWLLGARARTNALRDPPVHVPVRGHASRCLRSHSAAVWRRPQRPSRNARGQRRSQARTGAPQSSQLEAIPSRTLSLALSLAFPPFTVPSPPPSPPPLPPSSFSSLPLLHLLPPPLFPLLCHRPWLLVHLPLPPVTR